LARAIAASGPQQLSKADMAVEKAAKFSAPWLEG